METHIVLTFRREKDGALRCSSPKASPQINQSLDEVLEAGFRIETFVQGRQDDDFDILLAGEPRLPRSERAMVEAAPEERSLRPMANA
jgi:hypothetical protein